MEPRTSVDNKDILRVWWGLTGFYPSALIYHVFYQNYVCVGMYVFSKQLQLGVECQSMSTGQ